MRKVGASSRSASTAPSTSTRGASSPPLASSATRITSGVLDRHPLFVLVVAAGGAHAVRPLPVAAARARLEGRPLGLVVRAAQPLLALRCPSLGYRHGDPRLVAELPLQRRERCPARIHRRGAQPQGPAFRSWPQRGHSPRQSGRHSRYCGTASSNSSRTAGVRSITVASGGKG